MEYPAAVDKLPVYLTVPQIKVCAGLAAAVENKVTVAVGAVAHKCKCSGIVRVKDKSACIHLVPCKHFFKVKAEHITAYFSYKSRLCAQLCSHAHNICRRTACVLLVKSVPVLAADISKIHQQLSYTNDIRHNYLPLSENIFIILFY